MHFLSTRALPAYRAYRFSWRSPFQTLSCVSSVATASTRPCTDLIALRRAFPRHRPRHSYVSRDHRDSVASIVTSIVMSVTSVTHPPLRHRVFESRSGGVGEKKSGEVPAQAGLVKTKTELSDARSTLLVPTLHMADSPLYQHLRHR